MGDKCGACKVAVNNGVNGRVFDPLAIRMAWCYDCLDKYDNDNTPSRVKYNCSHCSNLFDPTQEGVAGEYTKYCGDCCCRYDVDENFTLADMSDKIANGATFQEA